MAANWRTRGDGAQFARVDGFRLRAERLLDGRAYWSAHEEAGWDIGKPFGVGGFCSDLGDARAFAERAASRLADKRRGLPPDGARRQAWARG